MLLVPALASCEMSEPGDPQSTALAPSTLAPAKAVKREGPMAIKSLDAELRAMVELAIADLIARREADSLASDDIEVMRAERVTWRSSALGCPMPDRGYLMVLSPGVRIVLRTATGEYEYHASRRGTPFLCEPPATIETPAPDPGDLDPT